MEEISNKTLTFLLISAVVISLAGTLISLNKIGQLEELTGITGMALSPNATVSVTVASNALLTFTNSSVSWGSGYVVGTNCSLNTTVAQSAVWQTACPDFNNVTTPLALQNDGNTNLTVYIKSSHNGTQMIGGGATAPIITPLFMFNVTQGEASTCYDSAGATPPALGEVWLNSNFSHMNATRDAAEKGTQICYKMAYTDSNDQLKIHLQITIPFDAPVATGNANITATGVAI